MTFSIITVVRNDETGLIRTGASITAQTFRDFEWIVIDGASTDGTIQVLRDLERNPEMAVRAVSEPDHGLYHAMNKGLDRACGEYLVFMNAGDELAEPVTLESVLEASSGDPPADLVYGDTIDVDPSGAQHYRRARAPTALWWTMFACHQAMFFRRDTVGSLRYELRFRTAADYAFVARFLSVPQARVVRMNEPLCRFSLGGTSWRHRRATIREDFDIRSTYLHVSRPVNLGLFLAHHVHTWMKRRLPAVTRRLRYTSPRPS